MVRDKARRGTSETFADRLAALKGDDVSYHELARRMQAAGLNVTAQGLHKWIALNGGIGVDKLRDVARYFGVSPVWLYFGEEDEVTDNKLDPLSSDARLVAEAWERMPERFRTPLAVEVFKVALAFTNDEQDRLFRLAVQRALQRIANGGT